MKKIVVSLLALTMVFGMAFAAGGKDNAASSGKKITLTFWTRSTWQNAIDPLVKEFQKQNPNIEVRPSYYSTDGIKDACKVAASSNSLPNMWFNWGGSLGQFYVDNGLTMDLTQYAKEHGWYDKFMSGPMNLATLSGQLCEYPTSYNMLVVQYRKDLFAKAGITSVPKTFEEMEVACAKLKAAGITPFSTAGLRGWHVMRLVELLIEHYAGAELHDKMNRFEESYDNPAVVKAFAKFKEFADKGYFPEGFLLANPDDTRIGVFSGRCAMDINNASYDGFIIQAGQDINNYDVFAFPTGGKNRVSAYIQGIQFNKNNTPEELEACIKWMDFYMSEENTSKYAEYYSRPIPFVDAKMPPDQPHVPVMLDIATKNGTFTITDQAFPTQVADVLFAMQDALVNNEVTPEAAAKNVQDAIVAYLKK